MPNSRLKSEGGNKMVTIKPYEPKYKEDVRQVCINTGPLEAATNPKMHDFILFTYCDYYCEQEPENVFVLVDENDKAQGYCFAALDFKTYKKAFKPYMKKVKEIGAEYYLETKGEVLLHELYSKKYPAHLHIDINEPFRGNGNGSRMVAAQLENIRSKGAKAIMLVVGASNTRGINFYKKNGFESIQKYAGGLVMAKEL